MEIRIDSLVEGARRAEGTVVIIDVFRAFTTAAVAFSRGAHEIVLVAEVDDALELRRRGRGELCMGEVGGVRPDGFDFGNSPYELSTAEVEGKTLIQSTRAGTVGAEAAVKAKSMYMCSFMVATATAKAILRDASELVTIVAMGDGGLARTDEDELCALYLRNLLRGRETGHDALRTLVLSSEHSMNFDNPERPQFHPMDRELALRIDSMPFAITAGQEDGLLVARPVQMS